jgi:DNA-binding MarR family transcriptional regulator
MPAAPVAVANNLRPVLLKLARELRREVRSLGVTGGQISLLNIIKASPGLGLRELAARERVSPPAMSGYIGRLEKAGLVARTVDASDRRRQVLTVTAAGERVLRAARSRRTAWLAVRLERLSEDERAAVGKAVEPLARLLEEDL